MRNDTISRADCESCKHNGKDWSEEPCDGCTGASSGYEADLISRAEAIEAVRKSIIKEYALTVIKSLPSADRPRGEWISKTGLCVGYNCSRCRRFAIEETNFCPNCGADMRPVKEVSE